MIFYDFLVTGVPFPLTYKSDKIFKVGSLFFLKVHGKKRLGILIKKNERPEIDIRQIKDIENRDFIGLVYPEEILTLILWMKEYYRVGFDKIIQFFLPSSVSYIEKSYYFFIREEEGLNEKEKKVLEYIKKRKRVSRRVLIKNFGASLSYVLQKLEKKGVIKKTAFMKLHKKNKVFSYELSEIRVPEKPTERQSRIIRDFFRETGKRIFLIHGVTGSGKTYIYREIVKEFLEKGKKVLVLVPEISLIPQIAPYFKFDKFNLFLWAFILSAEEKWNVIENTLSQEPCVVVAARSGVFIPFKNLGVIIVDEEQEESYKEKEKEPFYHARDIVIKRSEIENVPIIFGSATPSLEVYNLSRSSGIYYSIPERISGYSNPEVEIVSLRNEPVRFYLSVSMLESIEETLKKNKKVILFLNRRGFAHFLQCRFCGYVPLCPDCSISLTYYKKKNILLCHYCGWKEEPPEFCPKCNSYNIKVSSFGTEKIEEELKNLFPDRTICRMDREAISGRKKIFELFDKFIKGDIDILIGTQMVIKGLDNPLVGLAGVLYADQEINFPDFRARERMFQRLVQLTGRVRKEGKTIIQTYNPEELIFEKVKNFDLEGFYKEELEERKKLNYPPFSHITLIETQTKIREDGEEILEYIKRKIIKEGLKIQVLGPSLAPIEKIKGKYRNRLLLKAEKIYDLKRALDLIPEKLKFKIDLNPYDFL